MRRLTGYLPGELPTRSTAIGFLSYLGRVALPAGDLGRERADPVTDGGGGCANEQHLSAAADPSGAACEAHVPVSYLRRSTWLLC